MLRRALRSVSEQDYPGPLRVVVVYDGTQPEWRLARGGSRPVLVLENWRTPGVCGARNTGILAAGDCDLVALCEDDDTWSPTKLTTQVSALLASRDGLFSTCALEIEYDGRRIPKLTGLRTIRPDQLTRERARSLRASGFVANQHALVCPPARGGIGLLAEYAPADAAKWDLLLRAARLAPIVHVDEPLVRVLWRRRDLGPHTYARHAWTMRWMIKRHPEIATRGPSAARTLAELACWEAAAGDRAAAWDATRAALAAWWCEPRVAVAGAIAAGLVRGRLLRAVLGRLCTD